MGAKSRRKGAKGEREVALAFAAVFPSAKRGVGQTQSGDNQGDVVGVPNHWIESKRGKRTNPRAALAQAVEAVGARPYWPVAVTRDDGADAIVTMRLGDYLDLLSEWKAGRQ